MALMYQNQNNRSLDDVFSKSLKENYTKVLNQNNPPKISMPIAPKAGVVPSKKKK